MSASDPAGEPRAFPCVVTGTIGRYGGLWYVGWLFTVALAQLPLGKALLGLLIWPWYLGVAFR